MRGEVPELDREDVKLRLGIYFYKYKINPNSPTLSLLSLIEAL